MRPVVMISEEFGAVYAKELAAGIRLPPAVQADYDTAACLVSLEHKEIYLLSNKSTSQLFVMKQRPEMQAPVNEAEYAMLKSLDHEGIPKAVDCFTSNGYSYLIRDYMEGNTLDQLVRVRGVFALRDIIDVSLQLCDIFQYLHTRTPPVIYRDLKPQNVIRTPSGAVKLIDFDISRKFNPDAARDTVFMGTTATAPPEQYGYTQTDVRSDIYSLGVLIIYLGSGQYDIHAADRLPAELAGIAQKCTQFAPKDRYASMAQLRRRLILLRHRVFARLKTACVIACCLALGFLSGFKYAHNAGLPAATPAQTFMQARNASSRATHVSSEGVVTFASSQIEQNARRQLNKTESEPIYADELRGITRLCVMGDSEISDWNSARMDGGEKIFIRNTPVQRGSIRELTDIPLFENLMHLELFGQMIADISPLQGMKLFSLNLGGNFIRDLSPLAQMAELKSLKVGNNPIFDLTPLEKLQNLREIGLENTEIYDLTPLTRLEKLESVNLFNTSCMDYSPLAGLPRLAYVDVSDSTQADVAAVVRNKNLRELIVHRCGINDLELFEGLDKLARLELWGNGITNLTGIEKLELLSSLNLNYTSVTDLGPLAKMKRLSKLEILNVRADLTPLMDIPTLREIICSTDMQEQVDKIKDRARFAIEVREPW